MILLLFFLSQSLDFLKLEDGFKISVFANINNPRAMAYDSINNVLYVGSFNASKVYKVEIEKNLSKASKITVIANDLKMPVGVALHKGDLYASAVNKIIKFDNINSQTNFKYSVFYDNLPLETHHGWKFIKFGPDNRLYIPIGAPCNVCEKTDKRYSTITSIDENAKNFEIVAHGIRNSVGFDWHPQTNELWFTDNGRDNLGDNKPPDELNRMTKKGQHFGFPYMHGKNIADPDFGKDLVMSKYEKPAQELGPHVASLGIEFYRGQMFPAEFKNQIFIAEHGSWNRSNKIGYRISIVKIDENSNVLSYKAFITGWLNHETVNGRPVDVEVLNDGSMLISDDYANMIYRVTYTK